MVVGTHLEPDDAIDHRPGRGQHHDPHLVMLAHVAGERQLVFPGRWISRIARSAACFAHSARAAAAFSVRSASISNTRLSAQRIRAGVEGGGALFLSIAPHRFGYNRNRNGFNCKQIVRF